MIFLEFSLSLFSFIPPYDSIDVGYSLAFSESSLYIWKFSVYVLMKHSLENFEHYLASM